MSGNITVKFYTECRGNQTRFCSGPFWPVFAFPIDQLNSSDCRESTLEIAQRAVITTL